MIGVTYGTHINANVNNGKRIYTKHIIKRDSRMGLFTNCYLLTLNQFLSSLNIL